MLKNEVPEVVDIIEADPQPVTVPEDNIKDNDLNLTLTETEKNN